jgi:hypothetical protein
MSITIWELNAMKTRTVGLAVCVVGVPLLISGCVMQDKKSAQSEQNLQTMHYTCATADGELRVLDSEKKTTAQRVAAGVRSVVPISLVVGLVTQTAGVKYRIATGQYNDLIDKKIAEIKAACPGANVDLE